MYEKAIELDPQYAEAYASLGWTYWQEWVFRWSADPQTMERALALAQQALALNRVSVSKVGGKCVKIATEE